MYMHWEGGVTMRWETLSSKVGLSDTGSWTPAGTPLEESATKHGTWVNIPHPILSLLSSPLPIYSHSFLVTLSFIFLFLSLSFPLFSLQSPQSTHTHFAHPSPLIPFLPLLSSTFPPIYLLLSSANMPSSHHRRKPRCKRLRFSVQISKLLTNLQENNNFICQGKFTPPHCTGIQQQ